MRVINKSIICLFISLAAGVSHAHDFWLSPKSFHSEQAPSQIPVKFLVGHKNDIGPWSLSWDKVVALRTYSDGAYKDQVGNLVVNQPLMSGFVNVQLDTIGTHVLGFESYHSVSTLEANKFNSYAEKEGLALVLEARKRLNQNEQVGREIYSRKAKSLIQVGDVYTSNATKAIGHMLEIVPLVNPYQLDASNTLPFKVLFRGKALENALVDIASLTDNGAERQEMRSDSKGQVQFAVEQKGSWIVNVIWAVPSPNQDDAEFETYFSSLTFGY